MEHSLGSIKRIYFLGIGGIGMSALARYFAHKGLEVAGYDATPSSLTHELCAEGMSIHFNDSVGEIPREFIQNPDDLLVVYTPAVPCDLSEFQFFANNGYRVMKRAQALGLVAQSYQVAGVSGTHGKTSTSTLLAHLLSGTPLGCNAFLGGISRNFNSNLVLNNKGANRLVVEADEFDRSFLHLRPSLAIVTSMDADHLDIYGSHQKIIEAFGQYVSSLEPKGTIIIKQGLKQMLSAWLRNDTNVLTYSINGNADYYPENLTHREGFYRFDLRTPSGVIKGLELGVMGTYNAENAIAASAAAIEWGIQPAELATGLSSFRGVKRRFEVRYKGEGTIYLDDYAHHPEELKATIGSARSIFQGRRITGVFQPHLYSRTNDFAKEFAEALSMLDEVILTDIYPARETPIPGVNSAMLMERITCPMKELCGLNEVADRLAHRDVDVLITMGAGSIDRITDSIVGMLKEKEGKV